MALLEALVEQRTAGDRRYRHGAGPVQRPFPGVERRGQGRGGALVVLVDQQGERGVVVARGPARVARWELLRQRAGTPPEVDGLLALRRPIGFERGGGEGLPLPLDGRVAHVRTIRRRYSFRR